MEKKFLLVDVSAMYFRAFYAIRHLSNSKGLPTNALYGFLTMSLKLLDHFKPDYLAYCFDRKEPSFRKTMYPEYKANRSEMPEDLVPQVPYISVIAEALGAKCIEIPDYEADDIIGMLAVWGEKQKLDPIIVSGDKDFAQLVTKKTCMFEPMKEIYYGPDEVIEKWGVKPDQIIDYLALVGDSSDNIPGVRGIGPKGAQKLIGEFGSLESIYENVDKVKNKNLINKLNENKENAFLSKDLVTIVTENHVPYKELEDFEWGGVNDSELLKLVEEFEFKSLKKKLLDKKENTTSSEKPKKVKKEALPTYSFNDLKGKFPELELSYLPAKKIKVEEGLKNLDKKQDVFAFKFKKDIYLGQGDTLFQLPIQDPKIPAGLLWHGFDLKSIFRETKTIKFQVGSDLQLMAYTYSSKDVKNEDALIKSCFEEAESLQDEVGQYYLALLTIQSVLNQVLDGQKIHNIYEDLELPLVKILHSMESEGILLDQEELKEQKASIEKDLEKLTSGLNKELEVEINLDSPKQLSHVLFEVMGLPVIKKTKTGYSTDSEVLEKLSKDYPFCKNIIEYRELKKLLSTYIDALPRLVDKDDQKIHSHFNQAVTTTGRLSSSNPNLQNIPIRTERGNAVRKAFVAEEGSQLIAADYSQIELRVLAHITQDPALIKAFNEDIDIHSLTASEVYSVSLNKVDSNMRRNAKAINFGIAYGMGAYTLAENLQISRSEAKSIIDTYFDRFKNVKEYMSSIVEKAKTNGYVESIFGRRRYIEEIYSKNANIQKFGERAAINAPIQSSASDIVKKSMIAVAKEVDATMLMQVHDELVFQCPIDKVESEAKKIQSIMENAVKLNTKLKVNVGTGKNWQEAH